MKFTALFTGAFAAVSSLFSTIINAVPLINAGPAIMLNAEGLDEIRELLIYTAIGATIGLCGCWLATVGIKRLLTPQEGKIQSFLLTVIGTASVFVGIQIAMGKITLH
jgi:hypothetical protein